MTKQEFLESLERHLRGQIPEAQVLENIEYYRNYIEREINAGRSEGEILDSLGDPWLIAKTLIDSVKRNSYGKQVVDEYDSQEDPQEEIHLKKKKLDLTTWYGKLGVIVIAILVIILLFTIMSILIPIVICLAIISFIIKFFRNR